MSSFTPLDQDWTPTREELTRLAEASRTPSPFAIGYSPPAPPDPDHPAEPANPEPDDPAERDTPHDLNDPDEPEDPADPSPAAQPAPRVLRTPRSRASTLNPKSQIQNPKSPRATSRTRLNAVSHGLTSLGPVLPGVESEDDWAAFREGTVASLAPETALEQELAERVALSLWRLRRVARYETASAAAALDRVPADAASALLEREGVATRAQLRARLDFARGLAAFARYFCHVPDAEPVGAAEALGLVDLALARNPLAPRDALQLTPRTLFEHAPHDPRGAALPQDTPLAEIADWTAGGLRAVCAAIALQHELAGWLDYFRPAEDPHRFSLAELAQQSAELAEDASLAAALRVRQLESLLSAYDAEAERLQRERCLPPPEVLDRVTRYEAHLGRQYATALAQLTSLQSRRRAHSPSSPPAPSAHPNPEITKRTPSSPPPPSSPTPRSPHTPPETTKRTPPRQTPIQNPKSGDPLQRVIQNRNLASSRPPRKRNKRAHKRR